ncbi:hypothetical protein RHMOL_Rhmol02G0056700 [Rhododendron molle]|uniref:Uncharacterized protein n=1 Tax=Rhododendron molle TaxID=49168 RepID=A0ACC0PM07_RHOML|nr:hypothetical protein RHMOL_Rhmol02G0056700 [Rhododendron molle]
MRVFIGHLGLGQAQDGAPIRPLHVLLCTSRPWINSSSYGNFSAERLEFSRRYLHPKPPSHKRFPNSRRSKVATREDRPLSQSPFQALPLGLSGTPGGLCNLPWNQ